ncbi:benzoate/H(+) symporter BenE family transporter [Planctobacterium marinum]|uniref:Benzoate transporter n=1 Tax=Planctobacterium marinum TaxID=1631968 RepID=A0AA48KPY4_9ALTE|nr:benzoate transporter [Planctobacterium marinum]
MSKFNVSHISAGFTVVLVGYTSAIAIVIQAANAMGANAAQTQSWLLALGLAMGFSSIGFSWFYKTPIVTAWSTPGAVLLAGMSFQYDMALVVGAFMVNGLLIFATGMIKPLSRAIENIPPVLGTAMLGAILLPFCLGSFTVVGTMPIAFALMFLTFLLAKHFIPKYAMALLLVVAILLMVYQSDLAFSQLDFSIAKPVWVTPQLDIMAVLNLAIPLYLVTMLSQNLPGITVLKTHGYTVPVKPVLQGTGLVNAVMAPLGGFSLNLAAITAAICMTPEVDSDPKQRYKAALWAGGFYCLAGVFATAVVGLFSAMPIEIIKMLAGFALLGTLVTCLHSAFSDANSRESALLTFLIVLSGMQFLGLSSVIWGLLIGGGHLWFTCKRNQG